MTTPGISILEGKYMVTMDLFPQQSKEFNQIYPFYQTPERRALHHYQVQGLWRRAVSTAGNVSGVLRDKL